MSDQIDPEDLYKAAYRETQGQPVDAEPRRPIVAAQQDGGLVDRLHTLAVYMDRSQHEKWCKSKTVPVHGYSSEGVLLREAATALAEQDARIAEATRYAERLASILWQKHYKDQAPGWKPLFGDLVGILTQIDNMTSGLASRAECEGLRAADDLYVVWSHEHSCWWRANSQGYARRVEDAGVYTRAEAISISHRGRDGWRPEEKPDELPIRVADLPDFARAALSQKETGRE
jgi:hypothetical protein